jgi:hypothetical protein
VPFRKRQRGPDEDDLDREILGEVDPDLDLDPELEGEVHEDIPPDLDASELESLDEPVPEVEEEVIEEELPGRLPREEVEEEEELVGLGEPEEEELPGITEKVVPIRANEFVCRQCFLVKHKSQLADAEKMICLDCSLA